MKKHIFYFLLFFIINCQASFALNTPIASKYDKRILDITYNPIDVVQIQAVVGIATHIILESDEEYMTHAFGDAEAWTFDYQLNHYFIKPIADNASTNLTIVTNKRSYYFRLHFSGNSNTNPMYGIKFIYPDSLIKKIQQLELEQKLELYSSAEYNLNYDMSGDFDIAPINVWDNGQFTNFKFAGNADIPGIYISNEQGEETIANRHNVGDSNNIIVVHKISPKWILRLGSRALAVYNQFYDAQGINNTTNTSTDAVRRIIKR